jgi:hypothetical protein
MMRGEPQLKRGMYFGIGNLVDAFLTDKSCLNEHLRTFTDHKGEVQFTEAQWKQGKEMAEDALKDKWTQMMLADGDVQAEAYVDEHTFLYQGIPVTLPMKCRYDVLVKQHLLGCDFKTTIAQNLTAFRAALDKFDNDRQAALYMDLNGLDKFIFIGIGKSKDKVTRRYPIFHYVVQRGDATYQQGLDKYTQLGFHYKLLIHDFKIDLNDNSTDL